MQDTERDNDMMGDRPDYSPPSRTSEVVWPAVLAAALSMFGLVIAAANVFFSPHDYWQGFAVALTLEVAALVWAVLSTNDKE